MWKPLRKTRTVTGSTSRRGIPLNRSDREAYAALKVDEKTVKDAKKKDAQLDERVRDFMCSQFYDVRTSAP